MTLIPGTRIGAFEIVSSLGAGGMGEVYRATDARLSRQVAIKVLPAVFASDPERLARFEREAQAVAALSHPNILAIHDFGREATLAYAVMELLDGETLRERLTAGPLPSRKAIDYAVQIAQGLASAHDKGIAHRDLKPDNLFITRDDRIKILDFGLAKALSPAATSATLANTGATAAGTILGTVGYMAPEQVRGLDTDHRADIFAFGAVLYEMLTGRRAFPGETAADAMSAVLNSEPPDLDSVTSGLPPALERIVRRCLEKRPELRFQSARDLAFALETLAHPSRVGSVSSGAAPERAHRGPRLALGPVTVTIVVVAAALAAALGTFLWTRDDTPDARWDRFLQVTDAAGEEVSPTISPDGSTVAYAMKSRGSWDIYSQRVGGRNQTPVAADPDRHEESPAFSPNGNLIAFHEGDADGGVFVVGATGEAMRRITSFGAHPAWSPDGRQIAFTTEAIVDPASRQGASALWVVDVAGGAPRRIEGTADAAQPSWSPSGERIAYWSNTGGQRDIYTVAAAGGERVPVVNDSALDWAPAWMPDGRSLVFASNRGGAMNLWRIAVDQSSGRAMGAPEPVTAGVQAALEQASLSRDGRRLVFRSRIGAVNPVAVSFDPHSGTAGAGTILNTSNTTLIPVDISPDGRSISYFNQGEQQEDLFISARDGSGLRRITDDDARDRGPVWTRDGGSLVFYSNRGGRWETWRIGRDGGNLQKLAGLPDDDIVFPLLTSGDRLFVSSASAGMLMADLATIPAVPRLLENTELPGGILNGTWLSADGTKIVGPVVGPGGTPVGVGVYDIAASAARQVSEDSTFAPAWLSDGRRVIYFTRDGQLVLLDTVTRERRLVATQLPLEPKDTGFALSRDDRLLVYGGVRSESDIWVAELRDP